METKKMKIKKGDKVMVLSGKDKGKTGTVERVILKSSELIVAGINIAKKHVKVSKKNPAGGIVETADALKYIAIVKEVLGDEWLNNKLLRIGASRLANNLLTSIKGESVAYF